MEVENQKLYGETDKCLNTEEKESGIQNKEKKYHDSKQETAGITLKHVVKFLSVVTVSLLITLLIVTIMWYVKRVKDLEPKEHDLCLPCSELRSRYDEENVLEMFNRNNKTGECCGSTSSILKRLVDKSTKEKYSNDLSNKAVTVDLGCRKNQPQHFFASSSQDCDVADRIPEKPSAKLAGISFIDMEQDASGLPIVHWNTTGAQSFLKEPLQYMQGAIRIDQHGFYYIFSQLKWVINDTDTLPLCLQVYQKSDITGEQDVILETRKSNCELMEESAETTSSVGAIFELRHGDKIFVTTSRPENLLPCHHGNFFGLYLVAEAFSYNK